MRQVAYTEIDWVAYMEEVGGVIAGERDYVKLRGGTGPLVYPAGFVWLYQALYHATDGGRRIQLAQLIFVAIHTATVGVAAAVARLALPRPTPPLAVASLFLSRRAVSLFVLRLFNDGPQTLLTLAFVLLASVDAWGAALVVYSLALSVKMNALLYFPAVALLLCQARGFRGALTRLATLVALPQVAVAIPFLITYPRSYVARAFELSRVFMHKWSVNGAMLDADTFQSKPLAYALLGGHVATLLLFGHMRWTEPNTLGLFGLLGIVRTREGFRWRPSAPARKLRREHVIGVLYTCNFIGIVFARTLHYQFYVWYVYGVGVLVALTELPVVLKVAIPVVIEAVFNVYPPRALPAVTLHVCHLTVLLALARRQRAAKIGADGSADKQD